MYVEQQPVTFSNSTHNEMTIFLFLPKNTQAIIFDANLQYFIYFIFIFCLKTVKVLNKFYNFYHSKETVENIIQQSIICEIIYWGNNSQKVG